MLIASAACPSQPEGRTCSSITSSPRGLSTRRISRSPATGSRTSQKTSVPTAQSKVSFRNGSACSGIMATIVRG